MQSLLSSIWNTLIESDPLLWSVPLVIAIGGLFWWFTRKAAIRPLAARMGRLERSAKRARENAVQLAAAGHTVAQHLREQVPILDNAGGDLADMSVLARQTAGAAGEVATLAQGSRKTAERAAVDLSEVIDTMEETRAGLTEAGELIKTVDEVTVQANLLALSAAVEASRGGLASGAGDRLTDIAQQLHEVAIRSAEAARVAEQILRRTFANSRAGEQVAVGLRGGMVELDAVGTRMTRLSFEVAAAEKEKATELAVLSQRLATAHKVIDRASDVAAENATLGDEVCGQAGRATGIARELADLIGGYIETPDGPTAAARQVPVIAR